MKKSLLCVATNVVRQLKHKDSFGKSINLSIKKIMVFDHDYEGKSSVMVCKSLFFKFFFFYLCELFGGPPNKSLHVVNYNQSVIMIKSLIFKA